MGAENKNLVDERLIKKIFIGDLKDINSAITSIVDFYEKEPVLMKCLIEFSKSTQEYIARDYPTVKMGYPRIFNDMENVFQHFFLKGFKLGQESVRRQLDETLEDLIDIKSAADKNGVLPFADFGDKPEEDPESFS
ncbi:hypothetical protein N8457_00345 [bacterium]|nr:hypothetical protein [bacterium]